MDNMYQPPQSNLAVDSHTPEYAGFGVRLLASLIDSIWMLLLIMPLGWLFYGVAYFESEDFVQGGADFLISYVMPFLITLAFWLYKSATPGKLLLGIKIVDANTLAPAAPKTLVLRYVAYYISFIPLCLGFLWVIWDSKKQGWHDKIASTLVIRAK